MKRIAGWEKAINEVIKKHRKLPSQFGVSDCYLIADDAVEAVTGERMFPGVEYTSELGAAKELRSRGFETVADAFASLFDEIPVALAQRGDIGVIESDGELCGGFVSSIGFVTRDRVELRVVPTLTIKRAFKVGR